MQINKTLKLCSAILTSVLMLSFTAVSLESTVKADNNKASDIFFDDFSEGILDSEKWLAAKKNWGGKIKADGVKVDYNGGVLPENIEIRNGKLILRGNGNFYTGNICGINRDMSLREDGKRTGSAIATREYFASGSYEIYARVAPEFGACSAMWTFEYEEDWNTGKITNHEIDIEIPGRPASKVKDVSFNYALCNTWTGENEGEYLTGYTDTGINQADGLFHTYRFDWHTGDSDKNEEPRVEYYFDNKLVYTSYSHIPVNEGRLWLGLWFPVEWTGTPDFETTAFEIDYVKIIPFHESGDAEQNETYPDHGWGSADDISSGKVCADLNNDGQFSAADALIYQNWLLGFDNEIIISDADLDESGNADIADLCIMKHELLDAADK